MTTFTRSLWMVGRGPGMCSGAAAGTTPPYADKAIIGELGLIRGQRLNRFNPAA
ncbi:MAG: hypothetical protein PHO01_12940 [Desulfotomaculaceae bacterium]|nr:hypothetical protein [Desulfotomaculaceae bacterium]